MSDRHAISLTVNGISYNCEVDARMILADCLREMLDLTGTHLGCEHGVCGACTVLADGTAMRSCLIFAVQARGMAITTVEGLAKDGRLSPLQEAFRDNHALQCGFCTPGMLTTAEAFLAENPSPTRAEVESAISGNLCRCTGYVSIVDAIIDAATRQRKAASE
ncbi:MAG: (2Fe-2S)-binding protein [Pseudomonadota bacterium]|nr:(2Fe-2S)-binding protein [Pseudomonadota bacterium]